MCLSGAFMPRSIVSIEVIYLFWKTTSILIFIMKLIIAGLGQDILSNWRIFCKELVFELIFFLCKVSTRLLNRNIYIHSMSSTKSPENYITFEYLLLVYKKRHTKLWIRYKPDLIGQLHFHIENLYNTNLWVGKKNAQLFLATSTLTFKLLLSSFFHGIV